MSEDTESEYKIPYRELDCWIKVEPDGLRVNYSVYDLILEIVDGEEVIVMSESNMFEQDGLIIRGHVKWTGCSNWETNPDCMLHGCGKEGLTRIGDILGICWDLTKEYCDHWDGE
jgi:hypothetical protein